MGNESASGRDGTNLFWSDDPAEAKRYLEMGVDTILTNDYQPIAAATGLR